MVLNLVKSAEKRPREQLLGTAFSTAISHLNYQRGSAEQLVYLPWDFNRYAKQRGSQILAQIAPVIQQSLRHTSFFACAGPTAAGQEPSPAPGASPWVSCAAPVLSLPVFSYFENATGGVWVIQLSPAHSPGRVAAALMILTVSDT